LAGLIISESEYSHQATSNILPFRELFISFFFISIGILFDAGFMVRNLPVIMGLVVLTFVVKGTLAAFAARLLGYPIRSAVLVGLCLFQVGEFSLLLSKSGIQYGILDHQNYQYFLAVSILTMAATPFVLQHMDKISWFFLRSRLVNRVHQPLDKISPAKKGKPRTEIDKLEDHLIIIGFGLNGKNLARAAKNAGIKYVAVELNAETVKMESENGEPIIYGDAANSHVLHHIHAEKARVAVIAISDPQSTKRITQQLRLINPSLYLIIRTRFVAEMDENYKLGANAVIPEEFETSIEIFTRVLSKYLIPRDKIAQFTSRIRSANYKMLRETANDSGGMQRLDGLVPEIDVCALTVESGKTDIVGKTLLESRLRNKHKVTLIAIQRKEKVMTELDGNSKIENEDILYVLGLPENIKAFGKLINPA
jgi:CPA2 family monovalent cation:H+ antiporter-2